VKLESEGNLSQFMGQWLEEMKAKENMFVSEIKRTT
jgi:hypothetical protein